MATGGANFPELTPSSRSFSPGDYLKSAFEAQNGAKTFIRYSNKRVNATLTLGFSNISDADAALILTNYENVNSDWDYVTFDRGYATSGVTDTSLLAYLKESGSSLKWRYSAPPSVTSSFKGKSNVSCSFVACLDSP